MPPSRFVLLDGGVGHLLKSADHKGNLNFLGGALSPASAIREAHQKFADAGCDVLTTATFGVTPVSLRRAGLLSEEGEEIERITRRVARVAVEVAAEENDKRREKEKEKDMEKEKKEGEGGEEEAGGGGRGRGRRVLVAGCLPPLGGNCYLPNDDDSADAAAVYQRIATALLEAGVDIFLIETCSGGADAEAAARGAASAVAAAAAKSPSSPPPPPLPLWLSLTVDDEDPSRLRGGEGLEAAARRALDWGREEAKSRTLLPVSALLLNCSSPRAVSAALPLLRRAASDTRGGADLGIGCYANGFRRSTTSWLRFSSGGAAAPPSSSSSSSVPAAAPADAADEEGPDEDYDEDGMITAEAYARHAAGWVRSFRCRRSGGGGGERGGGSKGGDGGEESSPGSSSTSSFFVLGGCCGVGPEHLRVLRSLLDDSEEEGPL